MLHARRDIYVASFSGQYAEWHAMVVLSLPPSLESNLPKEFTSIHSLDNIFFLRGRLMLSVGKIKWLQRIVVFGGAPSIKICLRNGLKK